MLKCRICNHIDSHKSYSVHEMKYGLEAEFIYFECNQCGCLQISEYPVDIYKYYPNNYWSGVAFSDVFDSKKNLFKKHVKKTRTDLYLKYGKHVNQDLLDKYSHTNISLSGKWNWVKDFSEFCLNRNSPILDVGCGMGALLCLLKEQGFKDLTGVDKFVPEKFYSESVKIIKTSILNYNEEKKFDFIMFHHSFEHMNEPYKVLNKVYSLLSNKGIALIRVPVASYAWHKYNTNWVQLDAPRHYYLHTIKSFEYLAIKCNFSIHKIIFDSNEFQFWGSEQYQMGINLNSSASFINDKSLFPKDRIRDFKILANCLNNEYKGDQACFYICK